MDTLKKNSPYLLWACVIGYMALIFTLSSIPGSALRVPRFPHADKVAHLCVYGVLGGLLAVALRLHWNSARVWLLAFVVAVSYGVSDEFHQSFVPHRSPSLGDIVADAFGAALGIAVVAFFWPGVQGWLRQVGESDESKA